jgi:hypothetical protein
MPRNLVSSSYALIPCGEILALRSIAEELVSSVPSWIKKII